MFLGTGLAITRGGSRTPTFNPATLSLSMWLRNYSASPWAGTASAGTSGSNSASEATNPPTAGSLNGHGTATFNGTNQLITPAGTLGTYATAGASAGWALINIAALDVSGGNFSSDTIFTTTTSGYYDIELAAGNARFIIFDGAEKVAARAFSLSVPQLITWQHDGSTIKIGVNEAPGAAGGASSVAAGNVGSTANAVALGVNVNATFHLNGQIAEIAMSQGTLSAGNWTNVISYINAQYGTAF